MYKATVFICDHLRCVARGEDGKWHHLADDGWRSLQPGALHETACEAPVYQHTIGPGDELGHNTLDKRVLEDRELL